MTKKEFSQALRRGLGSAIIELKRVQNNMDYSDIVLRYCLRDIAHDPQVEGTKGYYLYSAVKILNNPEMFLGKIIDRFGKRLYWRLSEQLYDILCCFSDDGYKDADDALEKKYNDLKNRLPTLLKYNLVFCEREQFDSLMIRKLSSGFSTFKQSVYDIGEMITKRGNVDCVFFDFVLDCAKDKFGEKRVNGFISEMCEKSTAIKFLVDTLEESELSRREYQENMFSESVTVEYLLQNARAAASYEYPRFKMLRYRLMFVKKASDEDYMKLAYTVLREKDDTVKALLLMIFWRKPFPLDITPLIEYSKSDNALLSEIALEVLKYVKDKRIHDLAVQLLAEKGLDSFALGLLMKNYRKADDDIIRKLIVKTSNVLQHVQSDIADIYTHHRSETAFPILLHVYQRGECSHCRGNIVRAMSHCKVLSNEILEECVYDSFEDTRRYAKRLIARNSK